MISIVYNDGFVFIGKELDGFIFVSGGEVWRLCKVGCLREVI